MPGPDRLEPSKPGAEKSASPWTLGALAGIKAVAVSTQTVLLSWVKGFFGKSRPEASVLMWLPSWMRRWLGRGQAKDDPEATEEFATLSSFTLLPGQLRLRVGVVSVRGNYREHNEDNFYVPGRRSVRHDSTAENPSELSTVTL